jgi:hypothetical protein
MAATDPTSRGPSNYRWLKPQFTLKTLLAVFILVAGLLSAWSAFFGSAARISQLATGEDLIGSCVSVGCPDEPRTCRAIFRVDGRLSAHDSVLATLYSVQKGTVRRISSITSGPPARPTTDLLSSDFDVQFALCERGDSSPPALMLGVGGRKRAAGSGSFLSARRRASNVRVLAGPVPTKRAAIAYVEGDESVVQPTMTLHTFAESNGAGDYIVVTVQMVSTAHAAGLSSGAVESPGP